MTVGGRGRSRNRSRTQRKHFHDARGGARGASGLARCSNPNVNETSNPTWGPYSLHNPSFVEYYQEQEIVPSFEWDTFLEVLKTPLPATFRINSCSQFCTEIRSQLQDEFMRSLQVVNGELELLEGIKPLPWYPENLAWHTNFSRMQLRKTQTLERFHNFLKLENEIGNITRQEAVSMVPPIFLDILPHHFVLDMCAAPGSKTFQLLELMCKSSNPGSFPDGMVVANDVDVQRCNLLIHQTKRICTANLIVTNNEAQHFPSCFPSKKCFKISKIESWPNPSQLLFDRVLCDVPCSGDGTLRKAPDLWAKWNTGLGNGLHALQVQIAMRGLTMLKVGGRMVYSTCSMNPVENEAVIAEILRRSGTSVELIDVSDAHPQLVCRPGLQTWKVRHRGKWLSSHKDVAMCHGCGVLPSMFPTSRSYVSSTNETHLNENSYIANGEDGSVILEGPLVQDLIGKDSHLPLERCLRILPHDQDSGAFFIAVLHKVSPLPGIQEKISHGGLFVNKETNLFRSSDCMTEPINGVPADASKVLEPEEHVGPTAREKSSAGGEDAGMRKLQIQGKWKGVDPIIFFNDEAIISSIRLFYGIDESFPLSGHLISRNMDNSHVKRIYYISKSVRDVVELNFNSGQQLKISSIGLKMFERQSSREGGISNQCAFRISSDSLYVLLPHISKQILCSSLPDFVRLLQHKTIKFTDFVDAEFCQNVADLMMGCCIITLKDSKSMVDASTIAICCWKGRSNLSTLVAEADSQEMMQRLSKCGMDRSAILMEDYATHDPFQNSLLS